MVNIKQKRQNCCIFLKFQCANVSYLESRLHELSNPLYFSSFDAFLSLITFLSMELFIPYKAYKGI
jgi:hypothetical protein